MQIASARSVKADLDELPSTESGQSIGKPREQPTQHREKWNIGQLELGSCLVASLSQRTAVSDRQEPWLPAFPTIALAIGVNRKTEYITINRWRVVNDWNQRTKEKVEDEAAGKAVSGSAEEQSES